MPPKACCLAHGMGHEPAYPAISVQEWMNVVKPVMNCRNGQNPPGSSTAQPSVTHDEIVHERRQALRRRRKVASAATSSPSLRKAPGTIYLR
jgi:hypothetical protein